MLTEHLLAAVHAEVKMCCSGQRVMLAGDLNADPSVIPSLAGSMSWIDVEYLFCHGYRSGPRTHMPTPVGRG